MPGPDSWLSRDTEQSPRRRALQALLWTAGLTLLLLLNVTTVDGSASLADLAPAIAAGVFVGFASAIALGSTEGDDAPISHAVATFAALAVVLVASVAILVRWSTVAMVAFVLATVWTNALGHVGHLLVVPQVASDAS